MMKLPSITHNLPQASRWIKRGVGVICIALAVWGIRELTYLDLAPIVSPVQAEGTLVLRADTMGEGYFGASRTGGRKHKGIDLSAPLESPVKAAKGGMVIYSELTPKGMGEHIIIDHGKGLTSTYGHLFKRHIEKGHRVRQGELIGQVGKTGNARSSAIKPHLHFELRQNGEAIDPSSEQWLQALYKIEQPPRQRFRQTARGGQS
jgi:murein DD-endopeptidase MepM/ murein hydrolase activator NlpD